MFPTTRTPATAGRTALVLIALTALLLSLFSFARPASAEHTILGAFTPVETTGTPNPNNPNQLECLGFDFGYKIDESALVEGTHTYTSTDGVFTVTLNYNSTAKSVSFSGAAPPVSRFVVKGGSFGPTDGRTITNYPTPVTSGGPASAPNGAGVSHVTFCGYTPPSITVVKTGDSLSKVGDPVSYTVTITNTSATKTAYKVSITDTLALSLTSNAGCGASLAPLGSCTINYTYTVPAGAPDPLLNTVTAVYSSQAGGAGGVATVSDGHSVELFQPAITVVKTGPATAEVGEIVTYTVTITNTGSVDSPNLVIDSVVDSLAGTLTADVITECGELVRNVACVFTYDYEIPDADPDPLLNTVTVHTHPDGFPNDIWASDGHSVDFELGEIIVIKDDLTDSGDEFSFEATYDEGGFTLSDDGANAGDEDRNESGQIAAGEYDITEILEGDWELISLVCVGTLAEDGSTFEYLGATATVDLADGDTVTCTFTNDLEDELPDLILDKVSDCEICDAFTPGFYFNSSANEQSTGNVVANDLLGDSDPTTDAGPITIDGTTFGSVDDVQEYLDADIDGSSDGKKGLSATGQLVRHYLALQLNVWYADENDCDLGSLMVDETRSVQDLLDAAEALLAGSATDEQIRDLKDDIAAVNESTPGDDTLVCPDEQGETPLEGVTFTLVSEALEYEETGETDAEGRITFPDLEDGTYILTETAPEDCEPVGPWTVVVEGGEISVFLGEPEDEEELTADEDGSFTIVNECEGGGGEEEKGSITIIKNAIPDAAQNFMFTATGGDLPIFTLDDDTDPALLNIVTFEDLDPGMYSVTEVPVGGWTVTSVICTEGGTGNAGDRLATIALEAGENVTCTFVNTQDTVQGPLGSITILKNAIPDDAQDFGFTTTGAGLSSFSLDDDADATLSNQRTFSNLAAGSYSVTETAVAGWTLTGVTCSTGGTVSAATANIVLTPGLNVTCTFVNTRQGAGTGGSTSPVTSGVPNTSTFDAELMGGNTLGLLVAMGTIGGLLALATAGLLSANAQRARRRQ